MAYGTNVKITEKLILTQRETAAYAGFGLHKLERIIRENPDAPFVIKNGKHIQIKWREFEDFISQAKELPEA